MDRRNFLGAGATALAGLAMPKLLQGQTCANQTVTDNYGLGPFYLAGAPSRTQLASEWEPGQRIRISGTVENCKGPMAGVKLDVWHATQSGCYKHPNDTCPDIPGHPDSFRLRGVMMTDREGKYSFDTVKPGSYLNGDAYRPSHIHVIISHASLSKTIITQLYFQGDRYIPGDAGADDPNAANRTIPLTEAATGPWLGTWNIRIPGNTVTGVDMLSDPAARGFDVVMERNGRFLSFHLPSNTSRQPVEMRLYDVAGTLLKRSLHTVTPVELDATLLPSGGYIVDLGWWTDKGLRTESVPFHI